MKYRSCIFFRIYIRRIQMQSLIKNGVSWFDQELKTVNAHGVCVVKETEGYYLFGEYKTDTINKFIGFSCYFSVDLANWTFEKIVLPVQAKGILGPERIGERVKVIKSPKTGKYVMFMHTDNLSYTDPQIGVAISDTINGKYQMLGPLLLADEPLRRWDMGAFIDVDQKAYLLTHEGNIYQLSPDCLSIDNVIALDLAPGGESPAMIVENGIYFFLLSNKTSWERNDNYYLTASNIKGPWTHRGTFCPPNSLTYNSQCSFVLTNQENHHVRHLYMGDRWSFPKQASSATQIWLPLTITGTKLSVPDYWETWNYQKGINVKYELEELQSFHSTKHTERCVINFTGKQIAIYGTTNVKGGYARLTLLTRGEIVHQTVVDFYSLKEDTGLRYLSPQLEVGNYTIEIYNLGENSQWSDKRRADYGSIGHEIIISGYRVFT